ncbi:CoA-binding protein [Pontibacter sp. SGAir0037]|uniref:CoA-binding protein n=1 Tax=Pontibacter sp. SGAir0037 TaxID=2571030 RepID=UPI0010CD5692|nr:CoA-binding protein [Pontibacter sp. SGAir0037]QCR21931.1 CoA-binding protein [Pontibacter sp. SGAir0037]
MKKTVVVGATDNPSRYAYRAVHKLKQNGYEVVPVGLRKGEVAGIEMKNDLSETEEDVDTVTLYVGPKNQPYWYDYILALKPKRIIFNPGTENRELERLAAENNIEALHHCTLVMLASGTY